MAPPTRATAPPLRPRRPLALLLLLALALRLGWCFSPRVSNAPLSDLPDQVGYLELARNLLRHGQLKYVDDRFGQEVWAARTPGYPAFLAACGAEPRVARAVQALADTSTVLAVYLLALRLLPPGGWRHGPLAAAALAALNPFLVYFCALLLTETLFTAMLAWAMVLLVSPGRRAWLVGVALLALSVLVRPSGIALPVLLGAAAAWVRVKPNEVAGRGTALRGAFANTLAGALAGGLILAVLLAPWAWRNHRVFGRWIASTTNDGITLYDGFHPAATGASDQAFTEKIPNLREMGELGRNDYFSEAAERFIAEHPERLPGLTLRKIARTWSPVPLSREYGTRLYVAVGLLFSLPFDVLVVVGLLRGRVRGGAVAFLLLPALYFTAVHALSVGSLRYRVPAEPPLAVLAAAGAGRLFGVKELAADERGLGKKSVVSSQ